jgi:hypothetical protein
MKKRSAEVKHTVAKVQLRSISAQEHALEMAAVEVVEIARCSHDKSEAKELVIEALRALAKSFQAAPKAKPLVKIRSGFMSKCANGEAGECMCCGDERRLYPRPNQELWCAECTLDDIIVALNITPTQK